MIIRLTAAQCAAPLHWELIKFGAIKAEAVHEKDLPDYLLELLHDLLSNNAQCYFRLDPETREVLGLGVTKFLFDRITKRKTLLIRSVYSFKRISRSVWDEARDLVYDMAQEEGCEEVAFSTANERLGELAAEYGYRKQYSTYMYELGGS